MLILLTAPDLECAGGVAQHYRVLQPHFRSGVEYLTVGARSRGETGVHCGRRMVQDYRRFYRALRARPYDLVHLNPSLCRGALIRDGLFLWLAKSLGRKTVVFLHGWNPACEATIRRGLLPLFRRVYFRADAFIVLSSQFRSVLREFGYDKPIYVETTAVADDVFAPGVGGRVRAGTLDDPLNILYLARVERAKGIYEAIDAFHLLQARYRWATLTVAGAGSELEAARVHVGANGIPGVRFLGWVAGAQKRQTFTRADIYLFPSWTEGMPVSVLEAMAHGLPVVTRSVGGLVDFFEQGKMGFMTDSRAPEVFASLLEKLARDESLRRQMGDYSRRYAANRFRASQVARRLEEIYRAVAEGPRPVARTGGRAKSPEDPPSHPCSRQTR